MSRAVRRLVRDMRRRERAATPGVALRHGADIRAMREYNRLLVLNRVRSAPLTRVDIARQTGLSRTTVSSLIDSLLAEGLVREGDVLDAAPGGGRRPTLVQFHATAGYVIGVDIGRSHLTLLLTDLAAEIVARWSGPLAAEEGPDACLPRIVAAARALVAEAGLTWDRIVGAGAGIPGPIHYGRHTLVVPPRLPGWDGVNVRQMLERELGVPVYLDNDANMGALGESRYGAGQGVDDLAYIKIATGIGCGLVLGDSIYRGSVGSAGELGHVSIDEDGPVCDCGNRGCLETIAGADAIVHDAGVRSGRAAPATPAAHAAYNGRASSCDVAQVVQAALAGDEHARAAIEQAGEHIGVAVAGLINLFNPALVLVDGGVTRAGELLLAPLRRTAAARSLAVAWNATRIEAGRLGDHAIALGAVSTVLDAAFSLSPASMLREAAARVHESAPQHAPLPVAQPVPSPAPLATSATPAASVDGYA